MEFQFQRKAPKITRRTAVNIDEDNDFLKLEMLPLKRSKREEWVIPKETQRSRLMGQQESEVGMDSITEGPLSPTDGPEPSAPPLPEGVNLEHFGRISPISWGSSTSDVPPSPG